MAKKNKDALTDDELVSAIDYEVSAADYEGQSQISEQRSEADLAYTSEFTNGVYPTTGMSSILINTLQPAVDTLTTYLTKMFCSDKETVVFSSDDPEIAPKAREASKMVNKVIHKDNDGYKVINRWIKDAALHKNGIVKVVWDDSLKYHKETFEGSEEELNVVVAEYEGDGYEVTKLDKEKVTEILEITDDSTGDVLEVTEEMIQCTLKLAKPRNTPKIINIPPEEFLINEGATDINGDQLTRFVAHRQLVYISDVLRMFPDAKEDDLVGATASGYLEHEFETDIRHFHDGTYDQNDYEATQPNLRQIELIETWVRADRDGDGFAEWRHCFLAGRELLFDEEWFGPIPLCSFTFWPIPHKFYGLGVWDKLKDYHRTKTALVRSSIDSAVQANTWRILVDPRHVNMRDLKSGRPGPIATGAGFDPTMIKELPRGSGGGDSSTMLAYIDKEVIAQIGIDPVTGLVSADIEKSGNDSAKTAQTIDNASAKIEMFGRELAETGMRDMIWAVYDLQVQNGMMDDVGLDKSDIKAKVGLGHQTQQQKVFAAQAIIQQQTALSANPAKPMNIPTKYLLEASKHLAMSLGEEDPMRFFPTEEEMAQADAQAAQAAAQAQAQAMQMAQGQMQEEGANNESKRALEAAKAQLAQVEADGAQRKQQLDEEAKAMEIENTRIDNEMNERRQSAQEEQMAANLDLQAARDEHQIELAELKAANAIEVANIQAKSYSPGGDV